MATIQPSHLSNPNPSPKECRQPRGHLPAQLDMVQNVDRHDLCELAWENHATSGEGVEVKYKALQCGPR